MGEPKSIGVLVGPACDRTERPLTSTTTPQFHHHPSVPPPPQFHHPLSSTPLSSTTTPLSSTTTPSVPPPPPLSSTTTLPQIHHPLSSTSRSPTSSALTHHRPSLPQGQSCLERGRCTGDVARHLMRRDTCGLAHMPVSQRPKSERPVALGTGHRGRPHSHAGR